MSVDVLSLRSVPFRENYSSSIGSLLNEFYIPALSNAMSYDRAAGYFSSAIFALAPVAFSEFVTRGGKMRLLCSPHLSAADAEALLELPAADRPSALEVAATSLAALAHGSHLESRAAACLRALIDAGVLEVRFVTSGQSGLFHDKIGVFADSGRDEVSFIGSANETAAAMVRNHEQIETFQSWVSDDAARRCNRHGEQFEDTWLGLRHGLQVTSSLDASNVIRETVDAEPLEKIIESLREALGRAELQPEAIPLRDYQSAVLESWDRASHRGIIAFATGGGKTRTALEAVRRWTNSGKPALVMVPSELLHEQWAKEIRELLPNAALLLAGAGHSREGWSRRLADYTINDTSLGQRIVLSTYQTAATPRFLDLVRQGKHLLVVGDEVHSVGAPNTRLVLKKIVAGGRLGLSATPQRFGDPSGTAAVFDYFGSILTPEFRLRDALQQGWLVPYEYSFETCALTEEEEEKWDGLSTRVAQEIARNNGDLTEFALDLLRRRARIAKGAAGKAAIAKRVLAAEYKPGDRWLIYCNDLAHLREVRREVEPLGFDFMEYHSQNDATHEATLDYFTHRGGILLAIKCLDEGIDIPLINRALILASSTNPREYIQRRGRVLRRSPGKYSARLFDVLMVNRDGAALTQSEVTRAIEFADDARNVSPRLYLEQLLAASPGLDVSSPWDVEDSENGGQ
jgi:superfamily II DNA or RNA helicase